MNRKLIFVLLLLALLLVACRGAGQPDVVVEVEATVVPDTALIEGDMAAIPDAEEPAVEVPAVSEEMVLVPAAELMALEETAEQAVEAEQAAAEQVVELQAENEELVTVTDALSTTVVSLTERLQPWTPAGMVYERGQEQVPDDCGLEEPGMCETHTDVPAHGFSVFTGSPLIGVGISRMSYNAGERQAQVWIFTNPTTQTITIGPIMAWSGANSVSSFSTPAEEWVDAQTLLVTATEMLALRLAQMTDLDNCVESGCAPETLGYAIWECTKNTGNTGEGCKMVYSYDPVAGQSWMDAFVPMHTELYAWLTQLDEAQDRGETPDLMPPANLLRPIEVEMGADIENPTLNPR
jgi:hypothetical protein